MIDGQVRDDAQGVPGGTPWATVGRDDKTYPSYGPGGFREYLIGGGLADRTIGLYWNYVARFTLWCVEHGETLETIGPVGIQAYLDTIPKSHATRRGFRAALKHYWLYIDRDKPPLRAIRVPKKPRGVYRGLEPDEARMLVKTAFGWHPQGTAVMLGMYLALRSAEIAAAEWQRFDGEWLEWYTVLGKGDVTATLPVHLELARHLSRFQSPHYDGFLFPGSRGRAHITPASVWNWVRVVADEAGIGKLTPHQLRHTAIGTVNDSTGDLRVAQEFARHARPETTAIYTRVTADRLMAAVGGLNYR